MKRSRLKWASVLLVIFLAGCMGKLVDPPESSELEVVVVANPEEISVGGTTTLTVTATNNTENTIDFGRGSGSCWLDVQVRDMSSDELLRLQRICTADYTYRTLAPGEQRTESIVWPDKTFVDDDDVDVEAGLYEIIGVAQDIQSAPITVRVSE